MSLTITSARTALDAALSGITHIEWSSDGVNPTNVVADTALPNGMESASDQTTYARKGVLVNSPPLLSAAATSSVTISHFRLLASGTARTNWTALSSPVVLAQGGQISLGNLSLYEKLTPA